ncbi:lycopene cyclase [Halobacteriales archaeon SW_7_68_16]|nr:MAG: lycopene cyclase [Halobacteriales archaeon SW_7_68_16]
MPTPLTYLQFHALFVVPPLAVLAVAAWRRRLAVDRRVAGVGLAVITLLAVVYTTPWDSLLIERGVWWYGDGRVAGWVFGVPLGEFLFFVLQPALTALWTYHVCGRVVEGVNHSRADWLAGALAGVAVSLVGLALLARTSTLYLGAVLAWSGPVLALQWAVGWRYLLRTCRRVALAVGAPTLYLWAADRVAIADGIWVISETYTTGLAVGGLPVEEMTFFLVTNLFVVQGLVLLRWVVDRRGQAAGDPGRDRPLVAALERAESGVTRRWRR